MPKERANEKVFIGDVPGNSNNVKLESWDRGLFLFD
jgi:hypothetical protein